MIAGAAFAVSIVALVFSGTALSITYRKEAHRIRLEFSPIDWGNVVLGINNDSGIDTSVRSIGYFRYFGEVAWATGGIGNNSTNKPVALPLLVKARSTYEVFLNPSRSNVDVDDEVGLCVQLDTGRLYVITQGMAGRDAIKMHCVSWISRLSGGRWAPGIDRPRITRHR